MIARRIDFAPVVLGVLILPLGALLGMVIALGSQQLTLLAVGGVAGLLLLFLSSSSILTLLLVIGFVGVGLAWYYLGFFQATWLPYALSMFLWLKLPIDALAGNNARQGVMLSGLPAFAGFLLAFFVVAIVSTAVNQTPVINWLVGGKNFLFIWSIAFLVASGAISEDYLKRAWVGLLGVALLQAPFAAVQHFTTFASSGNWDAIVGTFGGDPEFSGGTGAMAIFLSIAVGLALAFTKNRQIPLWAGVVTFIAIMTALLLSEAKVFFVLVPLMVAVVLLREVRRRPAFVLASLAAVLASGTIVAVFYMNTYYKPGQSGLYDADARSYLDYISGWDTQPDFVNRKTGEVSRLGAPLIWFKLSQEAGPDKMLIGYGMTGSRISQTVGYGAAAKTVRFNLTTSTLTVLLWDTGALGAIFFVVMLALAALSAWRLSSSVRIPLFHRTALEATAGAFAVCLVSCLYNNALVDGPALQIFLAFMVGYVLYWSRRQASALNIGAR